MPEKKPILLTWWPIIAVFLMGMTSTAVDAYRLTRLEGEKSSFVNKETYAIQLATNADNVEKNTKEIKEIKKQQQQQINVRVRQEAIQNQLKENKQDIKALDNKMDDKFDDLKDFIRENSK